MKYSCDMIRDVMPLYYDDVCSDQTKKIVKEHLQECDSCKMMMKKMSDNTYNEWLQKEKESVINHYKSNVKKKTLMGGFGVFSVFLFICLAVNIITSKTIDWFFIVFASLMVFASLTVTPVVVETRKRLWMFGCFTISFMLLLLVCCLYSQGNWFWVASVSTLFGLSVVFLPFVIGQFPLKGFASQNKAMVVMAIDTVLLYAIIIVCGLYESSAHYWKDAFVITTVATLFVWFLFVIIRYLKYNKFIKSGISVIAGGIFFSLIHDIIYWTMEGVLHISLADANLHIWNNDRMINANLYLLILLLGCMIGSILLVIGVFYKRKAS